VLLFGDEEVHQQNDETDSGVKPSVTFSAKTAMRATKMSNQKQISKSPPVLCGQFAEDMLNAVRECVSGVTNTQHCNAVAKLIVVLREAVVLHANDNIKILIKSHSSDHTPGKVGRQELVNLKDVKTHQNISKYATELVSNPGTMAA
jgi:hypothetical protein